MSVIKGVKGAVYLASGTPTTFTDEAMTANPAKTVFSIDDATKRFWDMSTVPTVKYNGSAVTDYSAIQYPGGIVSWALTPGNEAVTVSGKYLPVAQLGYVRSWQLDVSQDYIDITCMGDTMRVNEPTFRSASVSIERFFVDESVFEDIMTAQALVGYDLFMDATLGSEHRFTGYGYLSSESVKAAVDGIIEEPLQIAGVGRPYYVAGLA